MTTARKSQTAPAEKSDNLKDFLGLFIYTHLK